MSSRRCFLGAGAAAALTSCFSRTKQSYVGYAFVATRDSGDIAVVNLAAFALEKERIKPSGKPVQLLNVPGTDFLFTVGDNGVLEEVSVGSSTITRKLKTAVAPGEVWLSADTQSLWALSFDRKKLLAVDRSSLETRREWSLPERAGSVAVSPGSAHVAVSFPASKRVGLLKDAGQKEFRVANLPLELGIIRYLKNGSMLLVAHREERQLTLVDSALARTVVQLPLPLQPENLCFSDDGGQLFITGAGLDAVVVVYPFQSQVAATLLSGKSPGPMAVSRKPEFLFVTSPSTDTVSVLSIPSQKLAAVVAVGNDPRCVVVTPDNDMALVLNRRSGDVAIIRLANIVSKRQKTAPLFTLIPVGSAPVAAVVRSVAG